MIRTQCRERGSVHTERMLFDFSVAESRPSRCRCVPASTAFTATFVKSRKTAGIAVSSTSRYGYPNLATW